MVDLKYNILELGIRILLAGMFIFQGYEKLFKLGTSSVYEYFYDEFQKLRVNPLLAKMLIFLSSSIELIAGGMLLLGFFRSYALFTLFGELILISVFFSFLKPMWDVKFVWPRLVLLVFEIIIPNSWASLALDTIIIP